MGTSAGIGASRPEVLIVHARGRWSGLPRLPKLCRRAGAKVVVFAPPGTDLWKSRYIDQRIAAPATEGAFAEALKSHLASAGDRYTWIMVGDENAVTELATQTETAWLAGWFPVDPTPENLSLITSKAAFTDAAARHALPIPVSYACRTLQEVQQSAEALSFPVMLKASRGFAGNGVRMAKSTSQLEQEFHALRHRTPVVVQKFEVGRVGSTQVLFDHGRLACWASSYKLAVFPEPFGPSSAREMMIHPDMQRVLSLVGRITGFHGLCGVDWLHRQSDGALLVLEFNPRPAPVIHLGPLSGVDFSAALSDMLRGISATRAPINVGPKRVYLFPQHLVRCIEKRYWRDLLHWLPGVSHNDLPWDQPKLLFTQSLMLLQRLYKVLRWNVRHQLRRPSKAVAVDKLACLSDAAPLPGAAASNNARRVA